MKLKRKLWAALCLLTLAVRSEEPPLEYWLADTAPFWSWEPATFIEQARPAGFQWTVEHQSARAAPLQAPIFGKDAYEAIVRFDNGSPHSLLVSYYNRGDATEPLSEAEFQSQVRELMTAITGTLRVQPRPGTNTSNRSDVRDDSRVWQRPKIQFELSYSYTPPGKGGAFRAEYIRLVAKEFTSAEIPSYARDRVNPYEIRKNVQRDPETGEVWIANIPMVDQGPKGYCAAATSERLLRYFGQEVDQHQIAQVANTTSSGGTTPEELKKALQAVGRQYGFSVDTHLEWDFEDFQEDMHDYNDLAFKRGARRVPLPQGGIWYINEMYLATDPDTWLEFKADDRSGSRKFQENVRKLVDGGCPLAWSVTVGMYPESTQTGAGGHLRLIIGYNLKTDELLYSDTWGRGHEKKSMPMNQAYAITKSLFSLQPKGLRL